MNDRVDRALRALRERETGASSHAEETLQRVLAGRLAAQRAWRRRARTWLPIAAVLAFSTAAVARWGSIGNVHALFVPRDEEATRGDVALTHPSAELTPAPSATDAGAPVASEEMLLPVPSIGFDHAPAGAGDVPSGAATTTTVPALAVARATMLATSVPTNRVGPAVATRRAAAASASKSAPVEVPSSRALAGTPSFDSDAYERAHRLHFGGGDPAAALEAWDDYLRRFPDGRFAPDARYNRAIDLVKLHRYVEARAELQPFAEGSLGGYHRDDARELLRSLP